MNSRTDLIRFWRDARGIAAVEVAMMLPVLMILFLGVIDVGRALIINKKTSTASTIAADLLSRYPSVTDARITDAWAAARMALQPYDNASLGMDVASIRFQGSNATPVVLWRETFNMDPNDNAENLAIGLGVEGEGVLVVTTQYDYTPPFTGTMTEEFTMQEVAVTRGRRSSYISRSD